MGIWNRYWNSWINHQLRTTCFIHMGSNKVDDALWSNLNDKEKTMYIC